MAQTGRPMDEDSIIKSGTTEKIVSGFKDLLNVLNDINKAFIGMAKESSNIKPPTNSKEWAETAKALNNVEQAYKGQYKTLIEIEKVRQEAENTRKKKAQADQVEIRNQRLIEQGTTRQLTEYQKLSRSLTEQRNRYKDLAAQQAQGIKLTKEEVAEINRLQSSVRTLDKTLKDIDGQVGQFQRNVGNYGDAWKGVGSAFMSFLPALSGGMLIGSAFETIKNFDEANADMAKTLGITTEEASKLSMEFTKLGSVTDIQGLQEIATIGGQFGLSAQEISGFVSSMDKLNVALGSDFGGVEETSKQLGALRNIFTDIKTTEIDKDLLNIGNALNELSSKGAKVDIVSDFANRISGLAIPLGVTSGEVLGLSATLANLNVNAERGGTAVGAILQKMTQDAKGFAKVAGVSTEEFTQLLNKDLVGAFKLVAQSFKGLEGDNVAMSSTLKDLGLSGSGASEVFLKMASNTKLLDDNIKLSTKSLTEQDSVLQEVEKKSSTVGASVARLGNAWDNFILGVNNGTGAQNYIITLFDYLAKNLESILTIMGRLITTFIAYKAVMQSLRLADYIKDVGGLANVFKTQAENVKNATTETGKYGQALKAIGWSALITVGIELARVFYDIASGTAEASEQYERYQKALNRGQEDGAKILERLRKQRDLEREQLADNKKANDEDLKAIEDNYKRRIKIEIERINAEKEIVKERNKLNEADQKRLDNAKQINEYLRSPYEKKLVENYRNGARQLDEYNEELRILYRELNEIDKTNTDSKISNLNSKFGKDDKQKVVDYTNAVRDLKTELMESDMDISTQYLKDISAIVNKTDDEIKRVREEAEKDKTIQIKSIEYIRQLEINRDNELKKRREKYLDDLYQYERELQLQRDKDLQDSAQQEFDASVFEQEVKTYKKSIEELTNYYAEKQRIENDATLSEEKRNLMLEDLELNHSNRMNEIQRETLRNTIESQKELIEELTKIYGESSEQVKQAELDLLRFQEQLASIQDNTKLNSDKGLKGTLSKVAEYFSNLMDAVMSKINQVIDQAIESQNKLIGNSERMMDYLRQGAAAGNKEAKESILAEERAIEQAQRRIEQLEKQRQRATFITGLLGSYSAKVANGDKNALMSTIADASVLGAFLRALPSFDVGADRMSNDGKNIDGKGGFLAINHPDERMLTADHNNKLKQVYGYDLTNDQLVKNLTHYKSISATSKQPMIVQNIVDNTEILNELRGMKRYDFSIDELFSLVKLTVNEKQKGNITSHVKTFRR